MLAPQTGGAIYYGDPVDRAHPLAYGLVSWWLAPPWYSSGPRLIDIAGRNHGTLTNGPTWTTGPPSGPTPFAALNFDGSDDKVALTSAFSVANGVSHFAWVNSGNQGNTATVRANKKTIFALNSSEILTWFPDVDLGQVNGATALTQGTWYFVGVTQTGTSYALYINGKADASGTTSALDDGATSAAIGVFSSASFPFLGKIGGVMDYNRALSAGEAWQLYGQARRGYPNLLRRLTPAVWSFGGTAAAGIAFDAASNSGYQAASSSYSWSHTCTGTDRFLAVDVSRLSVPGTTVTGITYNGVALTQIGTTSTGTDAGRVDCWGLANPASGSNTIVVTLSGVCISVGTAVSYTGAHQTTPTEAYNGATATNVGAADATVTITTAADNDFVHAAIATDDASVTAGQTSRNNVTGAGGSGADEDTGPKTPAGAQVMTYTNVGALATWAIGGYGIRPVAAAGTGHTTKLVGWGGLAGVGGVLVGPGGLAG